MPLPKNSLGFVLFLTASLVCTPCWAAQDPSAPAQTEPLAPGTNSVILERLDFAAGLYARNLYDMANAEYMEMIRKYPQDPEIYRAYFGLAESRFFAGQYQDALGSYRDFEKRFQSHSEMERVRQRIGECLFELGDVNQAQSIFNALQTEASGEARYTAFYHNGKVAFDKKDWPEARELFEKVQEPAEDNPFWEFANYYLGEIALSLNQPDQGLPHFQRISNSEKAGIQQLAWLGLGKIAFQKQAYAEAQSAFEKAAAVQGADAGVQEEALLNRLKALYNLEQFDVLAQAFEASQALFKTAQKRAEARQLVANAYAYQKNYTKAGEALQAIENDGEAGAEQRERAILGQAENLLLAGQIDTALKKVEGLDPAKAALPDRVLFLQAETFKRAGQKDRALALLTQLLEQYPDAAVYPRALFAKGQLYRDLEQPEKARETLRAFLEKFPKHEWADKALADVIIVDVQMKAWQDAIQDSIRLLENYPDSASARKTHYRLASLYSEAGDYAAAYTVYQTHKEKFANDQLEPDLEFFMGYTQQLAGDLQKALGHYAQVKKEGLSDYFYFATLKNRAYCHFQLGQTDEAAAVYQQIIREIPEHDLSPEVFFWLAGHLGEKGDPGAMRAVLEVFKTRPEAAVHQPELQFYLGESYRFEKLCDQALPAYEQVLAGPGAFHANALFGKAQCLVAAQNWDPALQAMKEALSLAKEDHALAVRIRMAAADALFAKKDFEEAAKGYFAVAILYDDAEHVPDALHQAAEAFALANKQEEALAASMELVARFPEHPLAAEARRRVEAKTAEKSAA